MRVLVLGLALIFGALCTSTGSAALLPLKNTTLGNESSWSGSFTPLVGATTSFSPKVMTSTPAPYGTLFGTVGGVQQGWLSNDQNGLANTPLGTYTFTQSFTNLLPSQIVSIKFDMLHDNNAVVKFNGNTVFTSSETIGYTLPADTVSFSAAALVGLNSLEFILQNTASLGTINPVGLTVKFDEQNTQINPIPEPASLCLWGSLTALGLIGAKRRRS